MIGEHYKAARHAAAVTELVSYGIIKVAGPDRISWLQGMISNDIDKLPPGKGCYAAHLTPQGKIVAHMDVFKDQDALWLSLERSSVPILLAAFDKLLIMEDVQLTDVSDEYSIIALFGPRASAAISEWLGAPLELHGLLTHRQVDDARIIASRLGYEIWVKRSNADPVLRFLAEHGVTAVDQGTWDVLRTETGIPVYGIDIDETTTLPELGEGAINYEKGCYIGQEVVAKVKYIGHVNRKFVGLRVQGSALPEAKSAIRKGGRDVGYVTTALFSPSLNQTIALGFVNRSAATARTEVEVGTTTGEVADLPFVKPLSHSGD